MVDADALARAVVAPGSPALAQVAKAFGPQALRSDGSLDRAFLAARVFSDEAERRRLEAITHPAVRRAMLAEVADLSARGHDLIFYDVPLLYEAGLSEALDAVVVVWTPRAVQMERLLRRDGLQEEQALGRLSAQLPIDEKAARADFVVDNQGPEEALSYKADRLLSDLHQGMGRRLPNASPLRY